MAPLAALARVASASTAAMRGLAAWQLVEAARPPRVDRVARAVTTAPTPAPTTPGPDPTQED